MDGRAASGLRWLGALGFGLLLLAVVAIVPLVARPHPVTLSESRTGAIVSLPASLTTLGAGYLTMRAGNLVDRDPLNLTVAIHRIVVPTGATVDVTLIELGGAAPLHWDYNGESVQTAASLYKLAALMMEAHRIASGATNASGQVCFQDADYEDGWFDDYADGVCFTRNELARRAGLYSDNTAGHMLVRDLGGVRTLDPWARAHGATHSVFYTSNTTTSDDLAALWQAEATGALGGAAAQAWLYPLLTNTTTEAGIPAGVQSRSTVVHKTGEIDYTVNDAALVVKGPNGPYVLTVMETGLVGDPAWSLVASISSAVWAFEASRAA